MKSIATLLLAATAISLTKPAFCPFQMRLSYKQLTNGVEANGQIWPNMMTDIHVPTADLKQKVEDVLFNVKQRGIGSFPEVFPS